MAYQAAHPPQLQLPSLHWRERKRCWGLTFPLEPFRFPFLLRSRSPRLLVKCETIGSSSTEGVGPGSPAGSSGEGTVFFAAGSASLLVRIGVVLLRLGPVKLGAFRGSRGMTGQRETVCLTVFLLNLPSNLLAHVLDAPPGPWRKVVAVPQG